MRARVRRIWLAMGATVAGLLVLTLLGWWLQRSRETDLADPVAGLTTAFEHAVPEEAPAIAFREVAAELGIVARHAPGSRGRTLPEDTGSGLAWGDYDGDGDPDLYLPNFTAPLGAPPTEAGENRLYRNDGERFVDVTTLAGVGDRSGFGMGASFADYDADGDLDLFVTNLGPNRLFRNRGDGGFQESAERTGVADPRWSIAAAWADYDRDGRLDLYVTNYVDYDASAAEAFSVDDPNWEGIPFTINPNAYDPLPNLLYRQLEGGRFTEEALLAGASNPEGRSLGAAFADLNGDRRPDLYVANDVSPNALLLNRTTEGGGGLFEDRSAPTGTADPRGSMGVSVAEVLELGDGSLLPDLLITHWVAQENALYQGIRAAGDRLEYRDKARQVRLAEVSLDDVGWGCGFLDLDLDGRLDILVANGSTLEDGASPPGLQPQRLALYWNDGERFHDLAPIAGPPFAESHVGRGLALADWDGDGDVDAAVSVNRGRPLLLRNDSPVRRERVALRLRGSPAATFGAAVEVRSGDRVQVRWIGADASYASQHAPEMVFGLGGHPEPPTVTARLMDGRVLRWNEVPVGRTLVLIAPETLNRG